MKKSFIFLGAFVLLSGWVIRDNVFAYSPVDLYDQVWKLVNTKFVDQTNNAQDWSKWRHKYDNKIQTNEDAYVAINTMVASLNDPYTKFLDPKEFADETSSIKGSLKGIGIQIAVKDGKLTVISPIEDTPAEKAGLQADDEILEIDGVSTKGITVDKAADRIRGKEGTQVTLLVKRKDMAPKRYTITRAEIEIKSISQKVPTDVKIPNDLCYVRLSSFISRNATKEFGNILNNSKDKKGYIIDLRSNPGGLLTNAIYISDMFLDGGTIVSTVDRDGYKETQRATSGVYTRKPVVVLINKGSASASEIFSGAMKDNHRAVIIGEQSFGKGLVQEINRLPYEAGINITIQKYLTPNGTDINKKGITPDIVVELTEEDVKNKNDVQLKKAIEVLSKMTNGHSVAAQ
ncbi:MAG: S41 family peptidase [Candidatus Gastranaerophilaceae bacterium]